MKPIIATGRPAILVVPVPFSNRLDWKLAANRLSTVLETLRPRLDLTASNPTKAGLHYSPMLLEALASPGGLDYSPDPRGLAPAREALGLGPHTLLSASTSEAYGWLFKLLCNPGDAILVPRPSYPLFEFLAKLESVEAVQYSLRYAEGWWLDFDSLERQIPPNAKAILFVHPNNPTGSYLKRGELERLAALCARRDLTLISDEVFADYPLMEDASRVATLGGNGQCLTFVLGGLSKSVGLPQLKAAWVTASGPQAAEAARGLELIADTYLSVSTPVQCALPVLLREGAAVRAQIQARTRTNLQTLQQSGLRPLQVEGGWYAVIPTPRTRTEEDWAIALLTEEQILTQPGYFYDFESDGWLVLSLLTPEAEFAAGVQAIERTFTV
ncbi:MAG TPA: pyridoxal phosphate-dependent aminotransferase [Bryobacteraceae bacterium]|nr:pyridoxal phosphate-dependent aminotransferase [Bryobacteraceae bacterium]